MPRGKFTHLLIACYAALALPAVAQPPAPGQDDPLSIYREAGISPEEESTIRELAKEYDAKTRVHSQLMSNLLSQMHTLSLQPDPDEATVLAKQNEINQLLSEMNNDKIKLLLKIRSSLKPDEKVRLVDIMRRRSESKQPQKESKR